MSIHRVPRPTHQISAHFKTVAVASASVGLRSGCVFCDLLVTLSA